MISVLVAAAMMTQFGEKVTSDNACARRVDLP